MIALKFVHIAAIVLWCGGLLVLPGLYAHRPKVESNAGLYNLQRFTRFAYVKAVSPAAFVAIGTGIALIFVREVYIPWMGLKLLAVGVLVLLHLRAGYIILHLYDPGRGYSSWRRLSTTGAIGAVVVLILWLVLAKPLLDPHRLPAWVREPGSLQSLLDTLIPIP